MAWNDVRYSVLRKLAVVNGAGFGVRLENSSHNTLAGVTVSNNQTGIGLMSGSNYNTLLGVTVSKNSSYGVSIDTSHFNTLAGVTASNNDIGVWLFGGISNTFLGVTLGNNSSDGIRMNSGASKNTFLGPTASNNGTGVNSSLSSGNNTFSGVTASNNATGINLDASNDNTFTGLLKVGNNSVADCTVTGGILPGLATTTCANNGASDAVRTTGITLASSFVGKVTSEDVANLSDTSGAKASFPPVPSAFDWTRFDNSYRGWGIEGAAFPDVNQRGRWTTGSGRIWDWSLRAADAINKGVLSLPSGNDTLTQVWTGTPATPDTPGCNAMRAGSVWNAIASACQTTFLRNAVEIPVDGIGNDNNLCESGETCLYMPNIGAYQGHGKLVSAGAFTNGTLTGITLQKFETNGR